MPPVDTVRTSDGTLHGDTRILPNPKEKQYRKIVMPKPKGTKVVRREDGKIDPDKSVVDNSPNNATMIVVGVVIGAVALLAIYYTCPAAIFALAI